MNTLMKYSIIGCITVFILLLPSCSDDESFDVTGSTENIVTINTGMYGPVSFPQGGANGFWYNMVTSPVGYALTNVPKIEAKFALQCTQPAPDNITVNFQQDNELVVENYLPLPGGVPLSMDKSSLTIFKGQTVSDSLTVYISNEGLALLSPLPEFATENFGMIETNSYYAPLKIVSISGGRLSVNTATPFLVIKNTVYNTNVTAATPSGSVFNKNELGWTVSGLTNSELMVDNSTSTYASSGNVNGLLPLDVEIDLQKVYGNIKGFIVTSSGNNRRMTRADIYVSDTSTSEYTLMGTASFANNNNHYVSFYKPVDARYIKIVIQAVQNQTNGIRFTNFNIYR